VIALLQQANKVRVSVVAQLLTQLGGFYRQTGSSLADLRAFVNGDRDAILEQAIQRAVDRGEIQAERVTERIARLPVDLFRYEIIMTLQPMSENAIEEVVDTIFLPLIGGPSSQSPR